jgi:hypothetical protein
MQVSEPLRFQRWDVVDDLSPSAWLAPGFIGCGVYVLEFNDGTQYVGQTVNLLNRTATHRRRWPGQITALRFAQVPQAALNRAERDVVARTVASGVVLRNTDLVSLPLSSAALDLVVDRAVQDDWLRGETEPLNIGERGALALQRRRTLEQYRILVGRPDYRDILQALADYVRRCLPWPHQTEARFWTITSMASTGRTNTWHRLAVINVNNVETMVLGEARDSAEGPWQPQGFINVDLRTAVPRALRRDVEIGSYGPVGEVKRLWVEDPRMVSTVLEEPSVAEGARRLTIGLLRKGKGMFSRYHDYNVADDVFATLHDGLPTA